MWLLPIYLLALINPPSPPEKQQLKIANKLMITNTSSAGPTETCPNKKDTKKPTKPL